MKRHWLALAAGAGLLAAPSARGDDFGRLLERAARKTAGDLMERSPIGSPLAPPGAPAAAPGSAPAVAAPTVEMVPVRTADGWTLVAHHYKPAAVRPGTMPVILCHGLTYNASFWDLDPSCSFARYLVAQGYDVWAVDLRGSGMSQKWIFKFDDAPTMFVGGAIRRLSRGKIAPTGYATVDPKAANWSLDHHIVYDLPAFVSLVRQQTGAQEVAWVGHSMGGIIAIAHLARFPNPGIGRLVTIGSQVTMPNGQLALQFLREMMQTRQRQLAGELTGPVLMDQTKTSVHNMFFNVSNASPKVYEALSGPATDVPALGLMRQYTALAMEGELTDGRKQFNYARSIGNIHVPMLIACGAQDQFAPPPVQQYLFDHVGSADKKLLIIGRQSGLSVDSGHDDSLVGLNSQAEVYPLIERWLAGAR